MAKKDMSKKAFKKAPGAPRRFKSAYMFFSTEKHKSIRQEQGKKLQTTDVAKMVSQAWKDLSPDEREVWEQLARRDKARYEVEKTMYTGPWKIPATKARSQKDPNAPKRPMSAFLSYSNSKRAAVKADHPDIGNAEVSRILAKMWKDAPEEERKRHIEKEYELRQRYKSAIAIWRQNADQELKAVRKRREDIALQRLENSPGSDSQGFLCIPDGCSSPPGLSSELGDPLLDMGDAAQDPEQDPAMPLPAGIEVSNNSDGTMPVAPYSSVSPPFGMGYNMNAAAMDDPTMVPQNLSAMQYGGNFVPSTGLRPAVPGLPALGVGGPMNRGNGGLGMSAAYGMMQTGVYPDGACGPEYGMMASANGFVNTMDQGYDPSGFYGGGAGNFYSPQGQMMVPAQPAMVAAGGWSGQIYPGTRSIQPNTSPCPPGFSYSGY